MGINHRGGRDQERGLDTSGVKLFHRFDARENEKHEHDALGDGEGRLGPFRRERVQGGHFHEGLRYQDEDIEVKGDHGSDDIDPARRSGETIGVARDDRGRQDDQRKAADDEGRSDPVEGAVASSVASTSPV